MRRVRVRRRSTKAEGREIEDALSDLKKVQDLLRGIMTTTRGYDGRITGAVQTVMKAATSLQRILGKALRER